MKNQYITTFCSKTPLGVINYGDKGVLSEYILIVPLSNVQFTSLHIYNVNFYVRSYLVKSNLTILKIICLDN